MVGKFSLHFSNIRGLRANFFAVYAHVQIHRPNILALSETQVCEDSDPHNFHIPGYHIHSIFFSHRGLVVYVRDDVVFQSMQQLDTTDPEFTCLWLKFRINLHVTHFGFLYRSPNQERDASFNGFDALSDSITKILEKCPASEIAIAGDFNIHNNSWLTHSNRTTPEGQYVELFAAHNHLVQMVNAPTHIPCVEGQFSNTLDLFLTSHPDKYEVNILAPLGNSDHCLVSASFSYSDLHVTSTPAMKRSIFMYEKARWAELDEFYKQFNWNLCFLDENVNAAAEMVENIILTGMKLFIPSKRISIKPSDKCWFNQACKEAVRSKEEAFSNWKLNKNPTTDMLRKLSRTNCAKVLRRAEFLYEQRLRAKVLSSPRGSKSFWSFVKRVKNNNSSSSIPTLIQNDQIFTDPVDKANLFAGIFAENSSLPESSQPLPVIEEVSSSMPEIFFRTRGVKKVLKELNVGKSPGPDGIPALVLSKCSSSLARPLRNLFSLSYRAGIFPARWKVANVQPIPKKGEATNPDNYRPIAICSTLSKVMETMINYHLVNYLEDNSLLSDRQYGFRRNRSTGDLMAFLTEQWNRSVHRLGESKVVALDISKAFDRVWHQALISKVNAFGLGRNFSRFISSFLRDRSIRVVIDGVSSNEYSINAGVPQGSVLSPSLFLIFINDLLDRTTNPIYSFADDSNLCHSYSFDRRPNLSVVQGKRREMNVMLNHDLHLISEWGRENRVEFNARKTQCCRISHKHTDDSTLPTISMGGLDVGESEALDVLGLKIQCDIRWNKHIFNVSKEAFKCLGFLKRCKRFFTPPDLLNIYTTYIRPKMEFNSHIWSGAPASTLELLDRVQKRALKLIGDSSVSSTVVSLEHRRNVGCVSLFYRYFHGKCSSELHGLIPEMRVFNRTTRLSSETHPFSVSWPMDRTTHYRNNSFFSRTTRMWNKLPSSVFPTSYDIVRFKSNLNKYFSLFPPTPIPTS